MLDTVIDFEVFENFCKSQPKQIPDGSEDDNDIWNSFWKFLKSGSNVTLTNYRDVGNVFLTGLTSNRKGTNIDMSEKYNPPYKNIFPKKTSNRTVFFLHETSDECQNGYRNNNGLLVGFLNDYKEKWKQLSLFRKDTVLPVRKEENNGLKSWQQISVYLTPFTDIIIVDNYIFSDENLWDSNLFQFLLTFNRATPIKFNLMIVSFIGRNDHIKFNDIYSKVQEKLRQNCINCNLCIVLTKQTLKEHDRGIFTNYLRIKSGDSFNYFDSNGNFITRTEIDFHTMVEVDKCLAAETVLRNIKKIVDTLEKDSEKEKYIKGKPSYNLLLE